MALEQQLLADPADPVIEALMPEERRNLLAANRAVQERIANDEYLRDAVCRLLMFEQEAWLRTLNVINITGDMTMEKRLEDHARSVAAGLLRARQRLTDAASLTTLASRLSTEE